MYTDHLVVRIEQSRRDLSSHVSVRDKKISEAQ